MSLPPQEPGSEGSSEGNSGPAVETDSNARVSAAAADLTAVVRRLVDLPDEVQVEGMSGRDGLLLEASVAPSDTGKVIGREGRTIQALRTLLDARGDQQGERYELDLLDD